MGNSRTQVWFGVLLSGAFFLLGILGFIGLLIAATLLTVTGEWMSCWGILFALFCIFATLFLLAGFRAYWFMLLLRGQLSQAERSLPKLFVLKPEEGPNPTALVLLARCYSDQQKYQDAKRVLKSFDINKPRNPGHSYEVALARICMGQENDDEAESVVQKAIERRNLNAISAFLIEWFQPLELDELHTTYLNKTNHQFPFFLKFRSSHLKRRVKVSASILGSGIAILYATYVMWFFMGTLLFFTSAEVSAQFGKNEQAANIYRLGFDSLNAIAQPVVVLNSIWKKDTSYIELARSYVALAREYRDGVGRKGGVYRNGVYRKANPVLVGMLYEQAMKFLDDHKLEIKTAGVSAYLPAEYACFEESRGNFDHANVLFAQAELAAKNIIRTTSDQSVKQRASLLASLLNDRRKNINKHMLPTKDPLRRIKWYQML